METTIQFSRHPKPGCFNLSGTGMTHFRTVVLEAAANAMIAIQDEWANSTDRRDHALLEETRKGDEESRLEWVLRILHGHKGPNYYSEVSYEQI